MKQKSIQLIALLILNTWLSLVGYPYQFRRLIQQENGAIKVVDLISEAHTGITHPALDIEKSDPFLHHYLLPDERNSFETASRQLLATLRYLAKTATENKKLLIESEPPETLTPTEVSEKRKELLQELFIHYLRYQFLRELSPERGQKIIAEPIDTIRKHPKVRPLMICFFLGKCGDESKTTVGELATPLFDELLRQPRSAADLCLEQAQNCPLIYLKLVKEWKEKKQQIVKYYTNYFEKTLKENPTMLIVDFIKTRKPPFKEDSKNTLVNILDFEGLIKILSSKERHVIVYAGGSHCISIAYYLQNSFGFKLFTHLGTMVKIPGPISYTFPLAKEIWAFLRESPENSLARAPLINLLHEPFLNRLFSELKNRSDKQRDATIVSLLNQGAATYADIANIQELSTGNTPYHYAIQDRFNLIGTLVTLNKLNANKYIKNNEGKTPLDYLPPSPTSAQK